MKNKINLRFLLALGNQKVVVLGENHDLTVYSDKPTEKQRVSSGRIATGILTR